MKGMFDDDSLSTEVTELVQEKVAAVAEEIESSTNSDHMIQARETFPANHIRTNFYHDLFRCSFKGRDVTSMLMLLITKIGGAFHCGSGCEHVSIGFIYIM